ncbi:hypothetical protein RHS01_05036 [Rhizoctonia solani]|uniref:Uncharacterized protein n=1 Tax=Rhizoctonia solani TaxID=456999 RepID=A0A8H7LWM2_9AGAM|nr:hypothetical protein RHS01_11124 [Rhizoctonia solani]KAF8755378.1 hypothetical protein RHS01_05036 [Rhizoctonia solani]
MPSWRNPPAAQGGSDQEEHWWIAEVYNPDLEKNHPAEFLTQMHLKNEEEKRLKSSDAERFLVLHKLHKLHRDGNISKHVFDNSFAVLTRSIINPASRHGLINLLRSDVLADAVKDVLDNLFLHPTFNASTWGKKLVKGRFYQLVADLLHEMIAQCKLIQSTSLLVDSQPFQLASQCCTWRYLEKSTLKKDHPWTKLPGGASSTLERVKQRPLDFVTFLNPDGSGEWTLSQTVLLPSVLTSELIYSELNTMYHLTQHLIKIIAGSESLDKYTSKTPHTSEEDHPVGIISRLIRYRTQGKQSNIPHMLIHQLWTNREIYVSELSQHGISNALSTESKEYNELLRLSKHWRELISLLKLSKLSEGVVLSKVPIPDAGSKAEALLLAVRKRQIQMDLNQSAGDGLEMPGPETTTEVQELDIDPPLQRSRLSTFLTGSLQPLDTAIKSRNLESTTSSDFLPAVKRQKVEVQDINSENISESEHHSSQDDDYIPSNMEVEDGQSGLEETGRRTLRCHHVLLEQLTELQERALHMSSGDARALSNLLSVIQSVDHTSYFGRVIRSLSNDGQRYAKRGAKAVLMVEAAENDWEGDNDDSMDDDNDGHSNRSGDSNHGEELIQGFVSL